MTSSPSEITETNEGADPMQPFADEVAEAVGGNAEVTYETVKISVDPGDWVEAHRKARDDFDLVFFSFLSAIDWSSEVAVGDPLNDEDVEERFEVITTVSDLTEGKRVTFSTDVSRESASLPSLISVYAGANWHEREAHEMFGIEFVDHPGLEPLYLPDGFQGNPLRKSYPLLSREVKPWPGKVDVEAMPEKDEGEDSSKDKPSTENPEA